MINIDEHKKLLEQVAELERNSVNYFDVEKEFFLIDSDNLPEVKTRLYGYSIQRTGIYEDDNLTPEAIAGLDGRGCYVYVEVKGGEITIKQDLNGCWGIYLFRHGDYFALSNSFFRLLDHVKFKYPLTVNRDYCNCLLTNGLCSHAYSETAVNEIQLLARNAVIHIDILRKTLEIELFDYKEASVLLDSKEGLVALDSWVEFWGNVLCSVAQNSNFMQMDLTGGFDSRMSLLMALHSGIDLNKICIYSIKGDYETYFQDYSIASAITKHYNLKLNQLLPTTEYLNYSISDIWNINDYHRQTFHKVPDVYMSKKSLDKIYYITGYSGETNRGYWHLPAEEFLEGQRIYRYSTDLSQEVSRSRETIVRLAFRAVCDKYNIKDKDSMSIPQYFYQETRVRNHYGKFTLGMYFSNKLLLSPALDPIIRALRLETAECPDPKLLMAVLFTRYEPDLLIFPFQGGRSIAPETIECAKQLNERFPICHKKVDNLNGGGANVSFTAA